jgi:hypothetical protein
LGRGAELAHFQPVIIGLIRFSFFQTLPIQLLPRGGAVR